MMVEAVAWDIDGTLVDSEPRHHRALLAASRSFGVDLSALAEDRFRGVHMHDVWAALAGRFPPALAREEWLGAIETAYVADAAALTALPGVAATVAAVSAAGLRQVCVSNSSRRVVDANLLALGLDGSIAFSISFDDVARGKPDPEPYLQACTRLGLPPGRVLAVEDSATGLRSALAAGLRTAAVGPDVSGSRDADLVLPRLDGLAAWLLQERREGTR